MRNLVIVLLAASVGTAFGQGAYRRPEPVSHALGDIERIRSHAFLDRHERNQLGDARNDLLRFEDGFARQRFDRNRLDGAINHLINAANSRRMPPREREVLLRDAQELREFRSRAAFPGRRRY